MKMVIMSKFNVFISGFLTGVAVFAALFYWVNRTPKVPEIIDIDYSERTEKTWESYKRNFIVNGMVLRNDSNDVVSEGQAYAMIRALVMDDQQTFKECYEWTENNLSRKNSVGDNLLAWNYKNGRIVDWATASDADLDYAFVLLLAGLIWDNPQYLNKSKVVREDILKYETYRNDSGRLYLLPWHSHGGAKVAGRIVQNLSYYSQAYFRIFYQLSNDERWLELLDTSYYLINSFLKQDRIVLVADWCSVDYNDYIGPFESKSSDFSWEAVRLPLRLLMDYYLFADPRSKDSLIKFNDFFKTSFKKNKRLNAGYSVTGDVKLKYENPIIYSVALILADYLNSDESYEQELRYIFENFVVNKDDDLYYGQTNDYYNNSLVWIVDWIENKKEEGYDIKERIIEYIN